MSEEYENEVEEMGEELSAEELFEQHRLEIEERFEEKGFFKRLIDMFAGLSKPRSSREYKIARVELQRLAAPLLAILLPTLGIIVLIVITAVTGQSKEVIQIEVARAQDDQEELTEESEPEPEEIDMTQDIDVSVDVQVDVPNVTTEVTSASESPGGEPDTVMAAPSPVTMSNIKGSPKLRGLGDGDGGGFGTQIKAGKPQDLEGALLGAIIDMKTAPDPDNPKGKDIGYSGWKEFIPRLKTCLQGNFTDDACRGVRKLSKRVAMSTLFIKPQPAANGPAAFGVSDIMEPKGWLVYYVGELIPTEKARYRFWGYFDDYMFIRLNGKVVWEYSWPCQSEKNAGACTGWQPNEETKALIAKVQYRSPQAGAKLMPSDWWEARPGTKIKIEIGISEVPGGACGGLLCIEKEGETYEMYKGQPAFPIFATRKLALKDIERFEKYGKENQGYKIGTDKVPLFNSRKTGKSSGGKKKANKKQVDVEVDI